MGGVDRSPAAAAAFRDAEKPFASTALRGNVAAMGTVLVLFLGLGGVVFIVWVLRQLRGGLGGGSHSAGEGGNSFVPYVGDHSSSFTPPHGGHSHGHGHHHGDHCDCGHDHGDAAASDSSGGGDSAGGDSGGDGGGSSD